MNEPDAPQIPRCPDCLALIEPPALRCEHCTDTILSTGPPPRRRRTSMLVRDSLSRRITPQATGRPAIVRWLSLIYLWAGVSALILMPLYRVDATEAAIAGSAGVLAIVWAAGLWRGSPLAWQLSCLLSLAVIAAALVGLLVVAVSVSQQLRIYVSARVLRDDCAQVLGLTGAIFANFMQLSVLRSMEVARHFKVRIEPEP